MTTAEHPIIVFDAECVLCSANARFVLRFDRAGHFRLASMQSEAGRTLYTKFGIDPADPETLIVVIGDEALRGTDAISAIWSGLGWPWRALAGLRMIPRGLRDPLYRWVARNRYRLFGKRPREQPGSQSSRAHRACRRYRAPWCGTLPTT